MTKMRVLCFSSRQISETVTKLLTQQTNSDETWVNNLPPAKGVPTFSIRGDRQFNPIATIATEKTQLRVWGLSGSGNEG